LRLFTVNTDTSRQARLGDWTEAAANVGEAAKRAPRYCGIAQGRHRPGQYAAQRCPGGIRRRAGPAGNVVDAGVPSAHQRFWSRSPRRPDQPTELQTRGASPRPLSGLVPSLLIGRHPRSPNPWVALNLHKNGNAVVSNKTDTPSLPKVTLTTFASYLTAASSERIDCIRQQIKIYEQEYRQGPPSTANFSKGRSKAAELARTSWCSSV
jgi:hypothetical protein